MTHSPLNIFRKFVSGPQLAIYFLTDNKKTREVAPGGEFDKILISNSQKGYNFANNIKIFRGVISLSLEWETLGKG